MRFEALEDISINAKLKPCPFCGGEASVYDIKVNMDVRYEVMCDSNKCFASLDHYFRSKSEAVEAWNRRVE